MFIQYIDHLRSIGKYHFTFQELQHANRISVDSAKSAVYRLKQQNKIITPAKGLYVIVPPEHRMEGSIPAEELTPIVMKHFKADYYVSLLSGASFYGASHQKSLRFQVITNKRIKHPLKFGKVELELIYKKSMVDLPLKDFAVPTGYLKIATPELIMLDLLSYPDRVGGLNHIATVLSELIESIDAKTFIQLAARVDKNIWLQRLGYILEQVDTMVEDKKLHLIEQLQSYLSKQKLTYTPLAPELPRTNFPHIKKWHIIANTTIESDL